MFYISFLCKFQSFKYFIALINIRIFSMKEKYLKVCYRCSGEQTKLWWYCLSIITWNANFRQLPVWNVHFMHLMSRMTSHMAICWLCLNILLHQTICSHKKLTTQKPWQFKWYYDFRLKHFVKWPSKLQLTLVLK